MSIAPSSIALLRRSALAGLLAFGGAATASAATWVYVANADSQEISVLSLDRQNGKLEPVQTLPVGGTVMPMAVSADKKMLYAALRSQPFRVVSMSIDAASGKLEKKGEASLAESMANIDLDATG
ncbi:MAG TPA: beta-propeller fold lactonase family protein, partial [Variovorax sp.]|nr:beta-propeller fold lactonase family protein [Variovorax sp.]